MVLDRGQGEAGAAWVFAVLVAIFVVFAPRAEARPQDIFTVSGVKVDRTAETVGRARELALADGNVRAFGKLLTRLTLEEDRGRLGDVSSERIGALVQDFEVEEEKTSASRYLATLTIRFQPSAVRKLLRSSGIPFTETLHKPILVLPVYESEGARVLWEDPNPWREAWARPVESETLIPIVSPLGDLNDVAIISADQALAGDADRLAQIAKRYEVDNVMVAHALLTFEPGSGIPTVRTVFQHYGPFADPTLVDSFSGTSRDGIDQFLGDVVRKIRRKMEEDWKRETVIRFDQQAELAVNVPVTDLGEWLAIRERLEAVSIVRAVNLAALTRRAARVVVQYLGGIDQLRVALAQKDVELVQEGGFWLLRLAPSLRAADPGSMAGPTANQ